MPVLEFDLREYSRFIDRIGQGRAISAMKRGVLSGALRSLSHLQTMTRLAAPANPSGKGVGGAVNIGTFLQGWKATKSDDGADIYNTAPHAPIVEEGRRAGAKMPPQEPIARWVMRRLGVSRSDAQGLAFVIARAIARRGLRARKILEGSTDEIARMVREEIDRELATELGHR